MRIEPLTKADFDWILNHFERFWDDDATRPRHHPIFVNELGDSGFVMRDEGGVAAYLFGLVATASPTGYVHMVAVRRDLRKAGLARRLYDHFVEHALARGCTRLKATVAPENERSIRFHLALGMETPEGDELGGGLRVMRDYAGPGIDRVVFIRVIGQAFE